MSSDSAVRSDGAPRVAIVAALESECVSLRRHSAAPWFVTQSGPGGERAAAAATRAVGAGARVLVSWGLAGGLTAGLAPGTVVVPRRVVSLGGEAFHTDAAWHSRLVALADELAIRVGDVLTVPTALESPDDKRAAAKRCDAVAVDMESGAIARVAAGAQVPFVALRVVFDGLLDALPRGAEQWLDEHGRRRLTPALRAVGDLRQWGALVTLVRRYRVASGALEKLASALVRRQVFAGDVPSARRAER